MRNERTRGRGRRGGQSRDETSASEPHPAPYYARLTATGRDFTREPTEWRACAPPPLVGCGWTGLKGSYSTYYADTHSHCWAELMSEKIQAGFTSVSRYRVCPWGSARHALYTGTRIYYEYSRGYIRSICSVKWNRRAIPLDCLALLPALYAPSLFFFLPISFPMRISMISTAWNSKINKGSRLRIKLFG